MSNLAGCYHLLTHNGLALDVVSENLRSTQPARVFALRFNHGVYQTWRLIPVPGISNTYTIAWDGPVRRVLHSGPENGGGQASSRAVFSATPAGGTEEQWTFAPIEPDRYQIVNRRTNLAMTLQFGGPTVVQESAAADLTQRWRLLPVLSRQQPRDASGGAGGRRK